MGVCSHSFRRIDGHANRTPRRTLFENNMLYFVGFTDSVTLLKVDPNTLTVVGKAAPMSPQLANVNTMCATGACASPLTYSFRFISEATAYNKLIVTVVWTDDSSNGGSTFSIYSLDTLDPVCSRTRFYRLSTQLASH